MIRELIIKYKDLVREMLLYGVFGLFSASMDTLTFMFFSKIGITLFLSNFISVNIGIAISFFLNAFLNFKKHNNLGHRALKFFGVGYIGLALSMFIIWLGVTVVRGNQILVKIISVIVVAVVQYIMNKFLTFKS